MLDSSRDTIAVALLKLGYSINTQNEEELQKAKEELIKQKPLVRSYEVDNYKNSMASGELAMVKVSPPLRVPVGRSFTAG